MNIPGAVCILAVLGTLLLCGCTSRHNTADGNTRSTESAEQELVIVIPARDLAQRGDIEVPVPNGGRSLIFIPYFERDLLLEIPPSRPLTIRYWYLQQRGTDHDAELISISDSTGTLVDRTHCELHGVAMTRRVVPISFGMPSPEFQAKHRNEFPNPPLLLGGCIVADFMPTRAYAYVCSQCESAYGRWKTSESPGE